MAACATGTGLTAHRTCRGSRLAETSATACARTNATATHQPASAGEIEGSRFPGSAAARRGSAIAPPSVRAPHAAAPIASVVLGRVESTLLSDILAILPVLPARLQGITPLTTCGWLFEVVAVRKVGE